MKFGVNFIIFRDRKQLQKIKIIKNETELVRRENRIFPVITR